MHVAGSRYCLQQVINLPFFQICRSDLLSYVVENIRLCPQIGKKLHVGYDYESAEPQIKH